MTSASLTSKRLKPETQKALHPHTRIYRLIQQHHERLGIKPGNIRSAIKSASGDSPSSEFSENELKNAHAAIQMLAPWEAIKAHIRENSETLGLSVMDGKRLLPTSRDSILEDLAEDPGASLIALGLLGMVTDTVFHFHQAWLDEKEAPFRRGDSGKEQQDAEFLKFSLHFHGVGFQKSMESNTKYIYRPILSGFFTASKFFMKTLGAATECFNLKFGRAPDKQEVEQLIKSTITLGKVLARSHVNLFTNLEKKLEAPPTHNTKGSVFDAACFEITTSSRGLEISIREEVLTRAFSIDPIPGLKVSTGCPAHANGVMNEFLAWMEKIGKEFYIPALSRANLLSAQK